MISSSRTHPLLPLSIKSFCARTSNILIIWFTWFYCKFFEIKISWILSVNNGISSGFIILGKFIIITFKCIGYNEFKLCIIFSWMFIFLPIISSTLTCLSLSLLEFSMANFSNYKYSFILSYSSNNKDKFPKLGLILETF